MTIFLLLALAATLLLLVLEGAWAVRMTPHKLKLLLLRGFNLIVAAIMVGMISIGVWHWSLLLIAVPLALGDQILAWLLRRRSGAAVRQRARNANTHRANTTNGAAGGRGKQHARAAVPSSFDMTEERALRVLGLKPGATKHQIKDAHRRLIRKMHPDRGGSSQAAAQINRAKDFLLGG